MPLPETTLLHNKQEKRAILEAKLEKQEEMLRAVAKMEEIDKVTGKANPCGKDFRQSVNRHIAFIKQELEYLSGTKDQREDPDEQIMNYWIEGEPLTRGRVTFWLKQLVDCRRNEQELKNALLGLDPSIKASQLSEHDKWKNIEPKWQFQLAESKLKLLNITEHRIHEFVPKGFFEEAQFLSRPISGTLIIKISKVKISFDTNETLIIQTRVDSRFSEPMKLKRNGGTCDLSVEGLKFECQQASNLEILIFDKKANLLGFVFFKLSWLEEYLQKTFNRSMNEKLELIPEGSITAQIRLQRHQQQSLQNYNDEGQSIIRQNAIKRKPLSKLGHEFLEFRKSSSLVLRCASCRELIYTSPSVSCRSNDGHLSSIVLNPFIECRFTCHKACCESVFIRCLACPNFRQWEEMTNALLQYGSSHKLERVSVRSPCFCSHCGRLVPITSSVGETFKCTLCDLYFHEDCEMYAMALCGLSLHQAKEIAKTYQKEEIRSSIVGTLPFGNSINSLQKFEEKQFEYLSVIGKGNFGKVMLARNKENGILYALKILKKSNIIENDEGESLIAERNIFSLARSEGFPFLVNCFGMFQNEARLFFVMEFVGGGDLMFHIQKSKFTEEQAKFFAAEVLLTIDYLHRRNIVYRDLKLDNILLSLDGHVKLADYGLCKAEMEVDSETSTFCGTPEFMAPEILEEKPYTRAVDWWAFGVLLYELLFSQAPFQGRSEREIFRSIISGRVSFPATASTTAKDLITKLLHRNASKRLGSGRNGVEMIKKHPFFDSVDFIKLGTKKVRSPFIPTLQFPTDVSNFDNEFTSEAPLLTPMPSLKYPQDTEEFFKMIINE